MTCTICGNEGLLSESGYCSVCTEKLKAFSEASSTFRQAAQTVISVEVSKKSLEAGSACEKEVAGIGESRVIFRFGQSEKCTLRHPFSVAIGPGGDIMVLDQPERSEYRVTVFDPDGGYTRTVVTCSKGHGTNQMKYPKGIASDLRGNFYIPDAGNNRIQRFNANGTCLGSIGSLGEGPGELDFPCDVVVDDAGTLYVADTNNNRVQKLTPQGVPLLSIGVPNAGSKTELDAPMGVALDKAGNIYVADTNHHRIIKYDREGAQLFTFGQEGTRQGEMTLPSDVQVGDEGTLYVADRDNTRVQMFDPVGTLLAHFSFEAIVGQGGGGGDIAVDSDGYLVICDRIAGMVAKVELFSPIRPTRGGMAQ